MAHPLIWLTRLPITLMLIRKKRRETNVLAFSLPLVEVQSTTRTVIVQFVLVQMDNFVLVRENITIRGSSDLQRVNRAKPIWVKMNFKQSTI